jgi:very-short-patch-repair endonuclease
MYRDKPQRDFARALRNQPNVAEKRLWHFLRAQKQRGRKFRRQAGGTIRRGWSCAYIVDYVCFTDKLVIEFDGPQHWDPQAVEHDERRTNWIAARGFHIIRFRNQELDENIHAVVDAIGRAIDALEMVRTHPSPTLPVEGREPDQGCFNVEGREPNQNCCGDEGTEPNGHDGAVEGSES